MNTDLEKRLADLESRLASNAASNLCNQYENADILRWQTDHQEKLAALTAIVRKQSEIIEMLAKAMNPAAAV